MFPPTADQVRPARRSLREALADAADLAIALVTLESYGLDDLRRALVGDEVIAPSTTALLDAGGAAATPSAPRPTPARSAPAAPPAPSSRLEHHRPLRATQRPRRPGRPTPREQLCTTPLEPTFSQPRTTSRRRTAPQDTPH